jgi:hypothetical protein
MEQGVKQNIKENKTYYLTMTVIHWIDVFTRKNPLLRWIFTA